VHRPLPAEQCATRDISVVRTNNRVNSVYAVQGRLSLRCSLDEGGTVTAKISFGSCT
jgi:hypothetical protein